MRPTRQTIAVAALALMAAAAAGDGPAQILPDAPPPPDRPPASVDAPPLGGFQPVPPPPATAQQAQEAARPPSPAPPPASPGPDARTEALVTALTTSPPPPELVALLGEVRQAAPFSPPQIDPFGLAAAGTIAPTGRFAVTPPKEAPLEEVFPLAVQSLAAGVTLVAPEERWLLAGEAEVRVGDRISLSFAGRSLEVDLAELDAEEATFFCPATGQRHRVRVMPSEMSFEGGAPEEPAISEIPGMSLERDR